MKKFTREELIIVFLSLIVIIQAGLLIYFWPKKKPKLTPPIKGKIAIVLDDWGYNLNNLNLLDEIRYPLNISVLPNLAYSKRLARSLKAGKHELILHLPLEPEPNRYIGLEKNTIMTNMPPKQIRQILFKDIKSLPNLKGASNHMGSKATRSEETMRVILDELKKSGLYFLDSLVGPDSVAEQLSLEINGKFVKRDVFIDNKSDGLYIKGQIKELKEKAAQRGYAIGIGHDRKSTLEVLKEVMPQLEEEGFKFVFVSELVK